MKEILLDASRSAALKAGEELRKGFGSHFSISSKEGRNNLVTEYDHLAESIIIEHLKKAFPESSFLAEESGETGKRNENQSLRWIIDPLDGTVNFAHSIPIFCISIAAELDGIIQTGIIYQPVLNEMYTAILNGGAYLNQKPIKTSAMDELDASFLVTGFPYNVNENPCKTIDLFVDVVQRGIPIRRLGSAAMDLAYVASGKFDGFWEIDLKPWDVAAGILLVREAGGMVTRFDGAEYKLGDRTMLATNGKIHQEVSGILDDC